MRTAKLSTNAAGIRRIARQLVQFETAEVIDKATAEVNCTRLAEMTAQELNHDEWLDDPDHVVWDIAVEVAEWYEKGLYKG